MSYHEATVQPRQFLSSLQTTMLESSDAITLSNIGALDVYPLVMFEGQSKEYAVVFEIPMIFRQKKIGLCDPKVVAYLFTNDIWSYMIIPGSKAIMAKRDSMYTFGILAASSGIEVFFPGTIMVQQQQANTRHRGSITVSAKTEGSPHHPIQCEVPSRPHIFPVKMVDLALQMSSIIKNNLALGLRGTAVKDKQVNNQYRHPPPAIVLHPSSTIPQVQPPPQIVQGRAPYPGHPQADYLVSHIWTTLYPSSAGTNNTSPQGIYPSVSSQALHPLHHPASGAQQSCMHFDHSGSARSSSQFYYAPYQAMIAAVPAVLPDKKQVHHEAYTAAIDYGAQLPLMPHNSAVIHFPWLTTDEAAAQNIFGYGDRHGPEIVRAWNASAEDHTG
ncbi:hypothetical protein EDC04DRAFT_2614040 [Pisolithus marmoratus]|nr:hypothetical protein EDC04DRAFT_2614040 [Pisolithus marmoratus]